MLRLLLILTVTLAASPALAGASAWQELLPGVMARLISTDVVTGGRLLAGFELDLPEGSKTYWRNPGETGIPPIFDFSTSSGLSNPAIAWPHPLAERDQGYLDYVYRGHLVLPLKVSVAGAAPSLGVKVTLGICSDVCVPATASFVLPLNLSRPDEGQGIRLEQAVADVPVPWDRPQPALG
ncbi:MAG: protein-disulfide reductase DsbD domain-containing protein, partial [Devosia sp.]